MMGLNDAQVAERVAKGEVNTPVDSGMKTTAQIIRENTITYFNIIFIVLAVLVIIAGSFRSLTFMPVVIVNSLIGIFQEIRARNVLAEMNLVNAPHTTVVRNGVETQIMSEQLVKDDIAIFRSGEQIPADAVVLAGMVKVNESLLTGESDEIEKGEGTELLSGSFVVSGEGYARIAKVGEESYISKLTIEAKSQTGQEQSEMIRSINRLILAIGIIIIPIGCILFYQGFFVNEEGFSQSIVSMVAAIVGMIPEGLYLLTTIALAVSTIRLAQRKILLHDMKSIETLARVDVLCVDKTGTITENTMSVHDIVETQTYREQKKSEPVTAILKDFVEQMTDDNITMHALKEYCQKISKEEQAFPRKPESMTPFSSEVKYCSVTFDEGAYVLGAPEMVLRQKYALYEEAIQQYTQKGYRVLVFGKYDGAINGKPLVENVSVYAYLLFANPIRERAKETFTYFGEQGVAIKVISGDNPSTVAEVANQAGIPNAMNYVDARTLTSPEMIDDAVEQYTVFGRVTPKQKQWIVHSLQDLGHTVAMTGDGVNDILAMKDADCSVAMASGSEAAAQAAQVVLLESDFACMPSVVAEGRRVVNNIQRSASLFLVKNIFSLLMAIFSAVLLITYPLEPSQVSLISMFNIGIPAFFLAMEPNKNRIEGRFMKNVILNALPAGLTDAIAIAALVICGKVFDLPAEDIATAATFLLAIVGFMILFKISQPMNGFRKVVMIGDMIGLVLCSIFLSNLFAINAVSRICVLLFVVFSFGAESMFRLFSNTITKVSEWRNPKEPKPQSKTNKTKQTFKKYMKENFFT